MSSNAATFAVGALAWADIGELLDAGLGVAALTFHALEGNPEAFAAPVAAARPLRGLVAVSERLRALTAGRAEPARGSRTRSACAACRRSAGALHEAVGGVHDVLAVEINARLGEPAGRGRGDPPPRRLPRRDLRARARRAAARARAVRQPLAARASRT